MRSPLIPAEGLRRRLAAPGPERPALLDVRWQLGGPSGVDEYLRGHIPGAVFVDLGTELSAPPGPGGRHPLPDTKSFSRDMQAAGVSHGRGVVVYDAANSMAAARAPGGCCATSATCRSRCSTAASRHGPPPATSSRPGESARSPVTSSPRPVACR